MNWFARYKTSRVWNINANIVLADVMSTTITAVVMDVAQARFATRLGLVGGTSVLDGAISLVVFAALHRYTNADRGFGDLVRVQIHRWVLSPLHYVLGATLQYLLLAAGMRVGVTVLVAYLTSVALLRTAHTIYGLRTGLFR
ncbi:MAG: hypothetical protein U0Q11_28530 [Vicinamibacterales bacterium]